MMNAANPNVDSIPWKNIITSIPVIVSILAYNSIMWCFVMSLFYLPVYFKTVYGLDSEETGVMTSIPILIGGSIVFIAGYITNHCIKKQQLTLTVAIKGCILSSFPLIIIAFTKCNINLVLICSLLRLFLGFCSVLGPSSGLIDMSPKFCVSQLGYMMETENLWKFVFTFSALFAIAMNSIYVFFGSTEVQSWRFKDVPKEEKKNIE